jgi:SWIM zinc finger
MTPWPTDDVLALAPDASAAAAARRAAVPGSWTATGCDDVALWGLFVGTSAEPYQVVVEFEAPAFRCSCPSRKYPCKHTLGLLLLWSAGHVAAGLTPPRFAAEWLARRAEKAAALATSTAARETDPEATPDTPTPRVRSGGSLRDDGAPPPKSGPDKRAMERAMRVAAGLSELDRWVEDCLRGGLTGPELAKYSTWERVASRLVDAQAPSLANRVRRLAGRVGVGVGWHEDVLGELGVLHLLARAGLRLPNLPDDLADSVRSALGFTTRQADVLAQAPDDDEWLICGRSDTLEDRIVVRRLWLRGRRSQRWALSLSFAAYGQNLDDRWVSGEQLTGGIHRYPGRCELRSILGTVKRSEGGVPHSTSLAGACDEVGDALGAVPWLERWPVNVMAAPSIAQGRWVLTDHTGSLPISGGAVPELVAVSEGRPVVMTAEWTAAGLLPLSVHLADRTVDVGPRGGFHERRWRGAA